MIPPDDDLIQELTVPQYELRNGKIKVMSKITMREILGRSPDKADALCLSFADDGMQSFIAESLIADYRG